MSRRTLIAANWKMYKTPEEATAFLEAFLPLAAGRDGTEVAIFPSATSLPAVVAASAGTGIAVGCQNIHFAEDGAYTGETSARMVKGVGATHVLIGHSERRQYFGESDEIVNKKLATALAHGLVPVVCVGEVLEEREANRTREVLVRQTELGLKGVSPEAMAPVVVAYEPVWAIGTGRTATPEMAAEAHLIIRSEIARMLGREVADAMRILYGGSVKPENAAQLCSQPEIDGALVGGASLNAASFAAIVNH